MFLPNGLSHTDSYDPNPEIGSEYRSPFQTIATKVPSTRLTQLKPLQAKVADKFTILRSMDQTATGHPARRLQRLSAGPGTGTGDTPRPRYPDWMSLPTTFGPKTTEASRVRGRKTWEPAVRRFMRNGRRSWMCFWQPPYRAQRGKPHSFRGP